MELHQWLDQERGRALALCDSLGFKKAAVSLWRDNGVPIEHMEAIVAHTDGAVTVEAMVAHAVARRAANAAEKAAKEAA